MVLLSVAIPMLDIADLRADVILESQHDPGTCAPSHNHILCAQAGANHAAPAPLDVRIRTHWIRAITPLRSLESAYAPVLAEGHPTRGPPTV